MFQTERDLQRRTGTKGTPRFEYLQQLVSEYQTLDEEFLALSTAASRNKNRVNSELLQRLHRNTALREQLLSNLANFGYDPINYEWLRALNVIQLFLDVLPEDEGKEIDVNSKTIELALAGLSNCCADPTNCKEVAEYGISGIISCLCESSNDVVIVHCFCIVNMLCSFVPELEEVKSFKQKIVQVATKYYARRQNKEVDPRSNSNIVVNMASIVLQQLQSTKT